MPSARPKYAASPPLECHRPSINTYRPPPPCDPLPSHRHTYGKCRPQKKKEVVYFDGEVVVKAAPVARRWENIEYDESTLPKPQAAVESESQSDDAEGGAEEEVVEAAPVEVAAAAAAPFVSTPESMAAKAAEA